MTIKFMKTMKKPVWSRKASPNGAEVVHSTVVRGHRLEVLNYPGSRTLMSGVYDLKGNLWHHGTHDRAESSVTSVKEYCQEIEARLVKEETSMRYKLL